jgi:hypothetical protein
MNRIGIIISFLILTGCGQVEQKINKVDNTIPEAKTATYQNNLEDNSNFPGWLMQLYQQK